MKLVIVVLATIPQITDLDMYKVVKTMSRNKKDFMETLQDNSLTYHIYFSRLVEMACSIFEWSNLPDTVDERYMELKLLGTGQAVFFKDAELGYLCLANSMVNGLDVYGIPKQRMAIGYNGYHKELNDTDSVIIYNNYLRTPLWDKILYYAQRLQLIDEIIKVNVNVQRTPLIIKCKENERLTLENLMKQYEGNRPFIFGEKSLDLDGIKVLNTSAPFLGLSLNELKDKIWNDALEYIGICYGNDKKERVITDEVNIDNISNRAMLYSRLNARKQACEKINKMFGLNIDCNIRTGILDKDGETSGNLYNGTPNDM